MLDVCSYPDSDRITNVPGCRFGQHRTHAVLCLFARAAGTLTQAQPSAAKAADSHRNGLRCRLGGAPGERERYVETGPRREAPGKLPRLRRAAENEDSHVVR